MEVVLSNLTVMKIIELVSLLVLVYGSATNTGTIPLEVVPSSTTNYLAPSAMELPSLLRQTSLCKETASLATRPSSVTVDQVVQHPMLSLHLPHSLPRSILHHQCLSLQILSILVMATPYFVCFLPMVVIYGRLVLIHQVNHIRQIHQIRPVQLQPLRVAVVVAAEPL